MAVVRSRALAFGLGLVVVVAGPAPAAALEYDEARAIQFANLAGAAYCSDESLSAWSCGTKCIPGVTNAHVCHGNSTKAYVALWEDQCLVSFQGTRDLYGWTTNLQTTPTALPWDKCKNCHVHEGFLQEWENLRACVMETLPNLGCPQGSQVRTTGHSMGAALNALAMIDLQVNGWQITESYDFGMPRTGDEGFANAFESLFRGVSFRVTHHKDPVLHLPPASLGVGGWQFAHKEPEVFYVGDLTQGYKLCDASNDLTCSNQYWFDILSLGDHLTYLGVRTGKKECVDVVAPGVNATAGDTLVV